MGRRPGSHIRNPRRGTVSQQVFGALNFTPALLRPVAWYDAADTATITESGGFVSQWNDKSGNGYDVIQATGTNQPATNSRTQNNRNVIDFDGSNDQLRTNGQVVSEITTSKALSQFVVCKSDRATGTSQGIFGAQRAVDDFRSGWVQETSPLNWTITRGGTGNSSSDFFSGNIVGASLLPIIFAAHVSATNNAIAAEVQNINQTLTPAFGGIMPPSDFMSLGSTNHILNIGSRGTVNRPFDGWIGEILLFDRYLTINERNALITFLNAKWGIY